MEVSRLTGSRLLAALVLAAALVLFAALIAANGLGAVWQSARLLGLRGFVAVTGWHLALMGVMGAAWWLLAATRLRRWPSFAWGRVVRDSAAEILPLSQLGGYVSGARAVVLVGVSGVFAAASTVVDVTVELVAQLGYTALGLLLLDRLRPGSGFVAPVLAGVVAMGGLVTAFIVVQARGIGVVERAGAGLVRTLLGRTSLGDPGQVQATIHTLHARRPALLGACLIHGSAWVLNGLETWFTLHLMGVGLSVAAALVIDSLLYGMRSVAFMVPSAIGVQEGGLILLCGLFGVDADAALALSLIKRARDLAIAMPALLVWQALEARRAWTRAGLRMSITAMVVPTQAERDAAYDNGAAVPAVAALTAARLAHSARWRAAQPGHLDIAYAPGERTRWDLFPAADPNAPCLVFIHGGWWQFGAREENAWVRAGVGAHGWSVALPGYTLTPDASLTRIVAEIGMALDWLRDHGRGHGIAGPVLLAGWSAGALLAVHGLAHPMVRAALAFSGAYELGPLRETYLNAKLRLTDTEIATLSPLRLPPAAKPLSLALGGDELQALLADARALHTRRRPVDPAGRLLELPGRNHFTIYEELCRPDGALVTELLRLQAISNGGTEGGQ